VSHAALLAVVPCRRSASFLLHQLDSDAAQHTWLWEKQLVDDNVMRVDAVCRELLDEPLGLIQREELGDADANECGLLLSRVNAMKTRGQAAAQTGARLQRIPHAKHSRGP
jgi:hypothetical protein